MTSSCLARRFRLTHFACFESHLKCRGICGYRMDKMKSRSSMAGSANAAALSASHASSFVFRVSAALAAAFSWPLWK